MKWISVKDRLPEESHDRVIVNVYEDDEWGNYVMEAVWLDRSFVSNGMIPIANIVTHWMPLPEPPKQ